MSIQLPTAPQTRAQIDPRHARFFVGGMPKAGKSTLLGAWAPTTTIIIDTQHGTDLLDGEHWVIHVANWGDFVGAVDAITRGGHPYLTVGIDMIDDVWVFAGEDVARRLNIPAAALADFGRGVAEQEAIFRREIGRLVGTPMGIWFLSHVEEVEGKKIGKGKSQTQLPSRMVPRIDKRVRPWVTGLCHFVLLAETLSGQRQLRTTPSPGFEAGSRVPLPSPMPLDARLLYGQINAGLRVAQPAKAADAAEKVKRERKSDVTPPDVKPDVKLADLPGPAEAQEGELEPPGTIEVELPAGEPAKQLAYLREQGCPCEDPLRAATEAGSFAEACPIAGHGVPWATQDTSLFDEAGEAA